MKINWNPLSRKRNILKKNMNWTQAKRRFPGLNPFGDADRDGVKNRFDCRPFNRLRQDAAETKERLKNLKKEISDIQMHHEDYPEELDNALSNVSDWIEED